MPEAPSPWAHLWTLDPAVAYLNHGSYGACPRAVLERQRELRDRLELEPARFFGSEAEGLLAAAREELGGFVGAEPDDLAFIQNATSGVNTVLRSLDFREGDELLTTDHAYQAARCTLEFVASRSGARVVTARVPFPIRGGEEVVEAVLGAVTPNTRLAVLDHVTSPTGLVFPIERLVADLDARGVDTLVDGAHAPGQVPLDLSRIGAAYYTGNCHKWLCAPKGAAFLYVREDRQAAVHPLAISHGYDAPLGGRTRFRREFDWMGTSDPTAWLAVPEVIRYLGGLLPGSWPELMARNHALALLARKILIEELGVETPCPEGMLGSLASVPLPAFAPGAATSALDHEALNELLYERRRIESWFWPWPCPGGKVVRISAQLYNTEAQFEGLAAAVWDLLRGEL